VGCDARADRGVARHGAFVSGSNGNDDGGGTGLDSTQSDGRHHFFSDLLAANAAM
jgi:hypothetical protein